MSNIVSIPKKVVIQDIRGKEDDFDIDKQGFIPLSEVPCMISQLLHVNGDFVASGSENMIKNHVESIVRNTFNEIEFMTIFTTMLRSSNPQDNSNGRRKPSPLIHIDQTPTAGRNYISQLLPEHLREMVSEGRARVRILSIWQPLVSVVLDWPLAIADAISVSNESLLESETRLVNERIGAMALMRYDANVSWWYWSRMTSTEALVIKNYDSIDATGRCPHTSFYDTRVDGIPGDTYRKSFEARVFLVTKE